jgi:hypothetical protein
VSGWFCGARPTYRTGDGQSVPVAPSTGWLSRLLGIGASSPAYVAYAPPPPVVTKDPTQAPNTPAPVTFAPVPAARAARARAS